MALWGIKLKSLCRSTTERKHVNIFLIFFGAFTNEDKETRGARTIWQLIGISRVAS